jgi:hypothetical protein
MTACAAVAMLATMGVGGCTDGGDPTIPSAGGVPSVTAAADPLAQELQFVACMREEGIADMPDPVPGDTSGRSAVRYAIDVMAKGSDPVFQAALDQCVGLLPEPPAVDPVPESSEDVEARLAWAQCMRDHGVNIPDPEADGEWWVDLGPAPTPIDPADTSAAAECHRLLIEGDE